MAALCIVVVLAVTFVPQALAQVEYCELYPPDVQRCFMDAKYHPLDPRDAHAACVRQFYVDTEPDLNLTRSDWEFFNRRVETKFGLVPPQTGFRIRKEYRRLTKEERIRLHSAFNVLYQKGIIHKFGRLHASATRNIHRGASFLPWHRVFIADLEEELRKVDPTVSLAYWDYTMDNNMTLPHESVVWTPCFFGNGNGTITQGPFRGWYGGRNGPIQRDYARDECENGRLINKNDILNVLSKCRLQDISSPPDEGRSNLEVLHDGIHNWVGGDMGDLSLSAFDPLFYFHHAFVDYVWELFRRNQVKKCGVDPENDYPVDNLAADADREGHRAFDRMFGYEHLRNVDGLSHLFIKTFYKYETVPQCPDCGSTYLYCDKQLHICISRDKSACDIPPGRNTYTGSGFDGVHVGFTGTVREGFHQFPKFHPFPARMAGDRRHRDMSHEDARAILMRESGIAPFSNIRAPFSPVYPMYGANGRPSQLDNHSNGFSQYDAMYAPLTWPYSRQSSKNRDMAYSQHYSLLPFPNSAMLPGRTAFGHNFRQTKPMPTIPGFGYNFGQTKSMRAIPGFGYNFGQTNPVPAIPTFGYNIGQTKPMPASPAFGYNIGQTNPMPAIPTFGYNIGQTKPMPASPAFTYQTPFASPRKGYYV